MLLNKNYSAIILAAGQGSRLSSITSNPKSLLTISGTSFLEYHLLNLQHVGITEVIVVVGYKKDLIVKHLENYRAGFNLVYVDNDDFLNKGNAYSLYLGIKATQKKTVILDGDFICEKDILKNFVQDPKENLLLVGPGSLDDIECAKVLVDLDGNVRQTIDKRAVTDQELETYSHAGEAMGAIKLSISGREELIKTSLDFFHHESHLGLNWEHLLNRYFENHCMGIHFVRTGRWVEVDTPEDYEQAKKKFP